MYKSFREMPVWQKAMDLSVAVFNITLGLPKAEDYGLISQIRRSANSVSANIAEGFGRYSNRDKCQFYVIARGSAYETQSHLIYGHNVKYFETAIVEKLIHDYDSLIYDLNKMMKVVRG
ncbi:four helix bundle protein [bacterium]|nr:four helix bundle protein [bacterium]